MATSTITLYKTDLTPERNAWVDNFDTYLASCTQYTISNFQFIKHELDLEIKIDFSQTYVDNPVYNYVKIVSNNVTRYYFIINPEWRASSTVKYYLSMDTINSFQTKLATAYWSEKTNIIRQHTDRFYQPDDWDSSTDTVLYRKVDKTNEGVEPAVMYKSLNRKLDDDNLKWYLVYASDTNDAVAVYITPSSSITINSFFTGTLNASDVTSGEGFEYWVIPATGFSLGTMQLTLATGGVINYTSAVGKIFYITKNGDYLKFVQFASTDNKTVVLEYDNVKAISVNTSSSAAYWNFRTGYFLSSEIEATASSTDWTPVSDLEISFSAWPLSAEINATITGLNGIDRSSSTIIKILELPYAPFKTTITNDIYSRPFGNISIVNNVTEAYSTNFYFLKLVDKSSEFGRELSTITLPNFKITIPAYANRFSTANSVFYESKIYNSVFYNVKFVYDSFSLGIPYEDIQVDTSNWTAENVDIYFKPTNTLASTMLFKITPENGVDETSDFSYYLVANRNNQATVYSNAYCDYIKTGYNYDVKAKYQQLATNVAGTVISGIGSVAGFGFSHKTQNVSAAAGISMATSSVNGLVGIISNYVSADRAIAQKKAELKAQAANIEYSDDLQLFNYYNEGNKLREMIYAPSEKFKNLIYDLFRITGYSFNTNGIPDFDSRRAYNYVQCEPVLKNEADPEFKDYLDDIKARYQAGVTYYHPFKTSSSGDSTYYDFDQTYENWETWICGR